MGALLKDKRIELWESKTVNNGGYADTVEEKVGTLWAYYRHASAKEHYASGSLSTVEDYEALFIINYRPDISPRTNYIVFRGQRYDIVGVDDYQGGRNDLKILAKAKK